MDQPIPTLQKIKDLHASMTQTQKRIGEYILDHPGSVVRSSITELADQMGVKSEASVVHFYRRLGFSGYKEFKIRIAQELASRTFYHSYEDINTDDSPASIKHKIFNGAISTLVANSQYDNVFAFERARDLVYQARRILFLGHAASAALCYYAHFRFLELGLDCHFSPDRHINATILARPNPGDLVFCISHSGETKDLISLLEKIAHKSISMILVTSFEHSTLSKLADVSLVTKGDETKIATDALSSRVAQLVVIDTLFSIVSLGRGEDALSRLMETRRAFLEYKQQ